MTDTSTPVETGACHVYGIVRSGVAAPTDEATVPDGIDVRVVSEGDIAAVVSMIDPSRPLGRKSDLVAHSAVLNALAAAGEAVLPVRFGSVLTTPESVADELLRPNSERWVELLDSFDGLTQFTLRGTYLQDRLLAEIVAARPDVAQLRRQTVEADEQEGYADRVRLGELVAHAVEEKRSVDTEQVREALERHCAAIRVTPGTGIDGLVDVAALVPDDHRAAFEQSAEQLAATLGERASFRLLGPLAPFDFVDEV